jgi:hypothetical protein
VRNALGPPFPSPLLRPRDGPHDSGRILDGLRAALAGPAHAPGRSATSCERPSLRALDGYALEENPPELENRLDRYRDGPWLDVVKLRPDEGEEYLYAEIHGFFAVDGGKCFAVIQWLQLVKRATAGGFPFDSWSREVAEAATTSRRCRFEFQVVPVECIALVAFVVPNPDEVDHFWVVPPVLEWLQFSAPAAFPS